MIRFKRVCLILLVAFHPVEFSVAQVAFTEISQEAGISHVHIAPDLMGGGVAVFDYNNDGLDDIYFTGGAYEDRLFKNMGNGTFDMISKNSAIYDTRVIKTYGVTTGDIDNDGFREIFVTTERDEPNILFYNNGDGSFTNISEDAGIVEKAWSMGAVFTDINLDGLLDIYVINYIKEPGNILDESSKDIIGFEHTCFENFLYINSGNMRFIESAADYNAANGGCGLAVSTTDIDNDGMVDLYIANDFGEWILPNAVYRNAYPVNGFTDVSGDYDLDIGIYGMGIASGDFNLDGLMDHYISNIGRNVLHKNKDGNSYEDFTDQAGIPCDKVDDLNSTSWGSAFLDIDNDGFEDLFVANGYIPAAKFIETSKTDADKLFLNNGDETFTDIADASGLAYPGISRGMAYTDFENDGDLDIVVNVVQRVLYNPENVKLYKNESAMNNNWVQIKLEGTRSNRDAFGARVHIYANNNHYIRELTSGGSHISQSTSTLHFGLETAVSIDSILVNWSGGTTQSLHEISDINQVLKITEGRNGYDISGCMDENASNYNPNAEINQGCFYKSSITRLDNELNTPLITYPNPVSDGYLYIEGPEGNYDYCIYSLKNELIRDGKLTLKTNRLLDLNELSPGLYILSVQKEGKTMLRKKIIRI